MCYVYASCARVCTHTRSSDVLDALRFLGLCLWGLRTLDGAVTLARATL